ncbi:MAG: hypothetical protein OEN20_02540, partial [Gammaproteobacteria bacterium]|nr:hypothetical protein [Gammaproteobacteria bacterium]
MPPHDDNPVIALHRSALCMVIRPLYLDDPSEFELDAYPLFANSGWNRAGSEPIIHASNDAQAVQEFLDHLREKS